MKDSANEFSYERTYHSFFSGPMEHEMPTLRQGEIIFRIAECG